jgi:hypothetical protein
MSEGFGMDVKADANAIGLVIVKQLEVHIEKTVNSIGGHTFGRGQGAHAVECAVDEAVSVYCKQFHIYQLLFCIF